MNTTISLNASTNPMYWDCECQTRYIHPKTNFTCPLCGAVPNEQPDSLMNEVANPSLWAEDFGRVLTITLTLGELQALCLAMNAANESLEHEAFIESIGASLIQEAVASKIWGLLAQTSA